MLLQTNSYIVPREKREEHARLLRRFRQTLIRLGCDHFEVYEQTGPNWSSGDTSGRFVQIMRFRDRKQQVAVQNAERSDPAAQALLQEFCELINLPYQQQHGLFAAGFYTSFMRMPELRHDNAAESDSKTETPEMTHEPHEEAGDHPLPASDGMHLEGADSGEAHVEIPPMERRDTEPDDDTEPDEAEPDEAEQDDMEPTSGFAADDDSDYSESAPPAGFQPDPANDSAHGTENPTFPSNS
jgi:hypothetical protein